MEADAIDTAASVLVRAEVCVGDLFKGSGVKDFQSVRGSGEDRIHREIKEKKTGAYRPS